MITTNEVRTIVESVVQDKVMIQYWYYLITLVLAAVAAYLGSYFATKGKNLATREDIGTITKMVEEVKNEYARKMEDYKFEFRRKEQAAKVAKILAEYHYGDRKDACGFMQLAWELSLWLPADSVRQLTVHLVKFQKGETNPKDVLVHVRKMLHGEKDDLSADQIIHINK